MTSPAPHRSTDLPPASREAVAAVDADPQAATKLLVTGGIGTGKSAVLAAVRASLRAAGIARADPAAATRRRRASGDVVDDAHLLDDADLDRLTELVADPDATVVVATQPLAHHPALRGLATALERENPAVDLGPLPPVEVARIAAATLGAPAPPELVRLLMSATAGLAVPAPRRPLGSRRRCTRRPAGRPFRAHRTTAPPRRAGARHPARVVAESRPRTRRRRRGVAAALGGGPRGGRPGPRQRTDRTLTPSELPAHGA